MKVEPQHIPQELKERDQWIVWRYETRGPQDKPTKVPYTPGVNRKALVSKPSTWRGFEDAVDALAADPHLDGLGYVLAAGDPYAGADLDHCLDMQTGEVAEWALAIVDALASYTEFTPDVDGLRVCTRGTLPPGRRRSEANGT